MTTTSKDFPRRGKLPLLNIYLAAANKSYRGKAPARCCKLLSWRRGPGRGAKIADQNRRHEPPFAEVATDASPPPSAVVSAERPRGHRPASGPTRAPGPADGPNPRRDHCALCRADGQASQSTQFRSTPPPPPATGRALSVGGWLGGSDRKRTGPPGPATTEGTPLRRRECQKHCAIPPGSCCPGSYMMLTEVLINQTKMLKRQPPGGLRRHFWGWLNAVFNQVDKERIQAVGPDRAASEWLLRCGASVRYHGYDKWQQDYNALPLGPLEKYKIQAINATESCIMNRGFDYFDGLKHLEEIKFCKCIYIEDACLQRISETPSLQKSLLRLFLISCGNVTDKGIIALHKLSNLEYLFLSDLPGIREKERTVQSLKKSMPALELELDLE